MFFFKLKTAYEVRISCWISDVCSSDLCRPTAVSGKRPAAVEGWRAPRACGCTVGQRDGRQPSSTRHGRHGHGAIIRRSTARTGARRSEEHTSELQSLMRISYAVFCLKTNKYIKKQKD